MIRKPAKTDRGIPPTIESRRAVETAHVWDLFVRLFHWSLVLSFGLAWLTRHTSNAIHYWAGYAAAALVAMRLLWGVLGTPYARFSQFIRGPKAVAHFIFAMLKGRESRHIGHNPAGGAMILALLTAMSTTALTGWLMTTNAFFGVGWVEAAHSLSADGLLLLIAMHVAGVAFASLRHRENLIGAMITGQKRKACAEDIA